MQMPPITPTRKRAPKSCARRLSCALDTSDTEISRFLRVKAPKPLRKVTQRRQILDHSQPAGAWRCALLACADPLRVPLRCPILRVAARSLDDRSYLTASSSWVCETLVKSSGELRSGALVVDIPVGDFHVSCESRFTSRGMRSSCWPPPPLGFWNPLPHDAAAFACDISSFHRRMVSARSSGSHPVGLECSLLLESC